MKQLSPDDVIIDALVAVQERCGDLPVQRRVWSAEYTDRCAAYSVTPEIQLFPYAFVVCHERKIYPLLHPLVTGVEAEEVAWQMCRRRSRGAPIDHSAQRLEVQLVCHGFGISPNPDEWYEKLAADGRRKRHALARNRGEHQLGFFDLVNTGATWAVDDEAEQAVADVQEEGLIARQVHIVDNVQRVMTSAGVELADIADGFKRLRKAPPGSTLGDIYR